MAIGIGAAVRGCGWMGAGWFHRMASMFGLSPTIILTAAASTTTIAATGDKAFPVWIDLLHVSRGCSVKVVNETRHPFRLRGRRGCAGALGATARTVRGTGV